MCSSEKETIKQIFRFQSQQCAKENTHTHVGLIDFWHSVVFPFVLFSLVFLTIKLDGWRQSIHACDNCAPPVLWDFAEVIIMCGFGEWRSVNLQPLKLCSSQRKTTWNYSRTYSSGCDAILDFFAGCWYIYQSLTVNSGCIPYTWGVLTVIETPSVKSEDLDF